MARNLVTALLVVMAPLAALAQSGAPPAPKPFTQDYRLRVETVDDDLFADSSRAVTLRARLGWRSPVYNGFSAYIEGEGIVALDEGDYNSTANRQPTRPVIADPPGAEVNQAYVAYGFGTPSQLIVGRQRLNYDNQRFIGSVAFRQNEQTYDAIGVQHAAGALTLRAAYLDKVHRIFGNDNPSPLLREWDLDSYLINLSYLYGTHTLVGYLYAIENQDLPLTSHINIGARWSGSRLLSDAWRWNHTLEYAQQSDHADGAANIDARYFAIDNALSFKDGAFSVRMLLERLGGDGTYGFQTPLATLHAFNGWADRFLTTPRDGLRDQMIEVAGKVAGGTLSARLHRFRSDRGSVDFGTEWGLQYVRPLTATLTLTGKFASYDADKFSDDVRKLWLFVDYRP